LVAINELELELEYRPNVACLTYRWTESIIFIGATIEIYVINDNFCSVFSIKLLLGCLTHTCVYTLTHIL